MLTKKLVEVLVFLHNPSKMVTFHLKGFYLTEGKIDDTSLAQHFLWTLKLAKYNDVVLVVTIEIAPLSIHSILWLQVSRKIPVGLWQCKIYLNPL